MADKKPLNCPCCGSTATVEPHLIEAGFINKDGQTWPDWWTASVNCDDIYEHGCSLQLIAGGDTEEEAVEAAVGMWNRRVNGVGSAEPGKDGVVSRDESIADIMAQLDKLTDEALEYLSHWSMPFGVLPMLRDYEDGKLLRDCDAETQSLLDREDCEAALDRACRFAAESTGSCPLDVFDAQPRPCETECSADIDRAECWRRWFEREDA